MSLYGKSAHPNRRTGRVRGAMPDGCARAASRPRGPRQVCASERTALTEAAVQYPGFKEMRAGIWGISNQAAHHRLPRTSGDLDYDGLGCTL